MILALLRLELRHGAALILLPLLLVLSWITISLIVPSLDLAPRAWIGVLARDTLLLTAPCLAAFSAWLAGQDGRSGSDEVLAAAAASPMPRYLARWGAQCCWGLLAYGIASLWIALGVVPPATAWGPFDPGPWLVGLVALLAAAAIGSLVGATLRTPLAPPLLALLLFAGQALLGWYRGSLGGVRFLSPLAGHNVSVWYGAIPHVALAQMLYFGGVTLCCLALALLRAWRHAVGCHVHRLWWPGGCTVLAGGITLGAIGILLLCRTAPSLADRYAEPANASARGEYGHPATIPFTPSCRKVQHLIVCLHPAYVSLLPANAAVVGAIAAPLVGLPGGPRRAEQEPGGLTRLAGGVLSFLPDDNPASGAFATDLALALIRDAQSRKRCPSLNAPDRCRLAQDALIAWMVHRAGFQVSVAQPGFASSFHYSVDPAALPVAARFSRLAKGQQEAWLRAHYQDLRAGTIAVDLLP